MGLVAPRHVGSSRTRARTRVLYVGRRILNHCATREAPFFFKKFIYIFIFGCVVFWLLRGFFSSCGERRLLLCAGFSLRLLLFLWSTGYRHAGSVVVAHGLSSCGSWALERRLSSCGARA